ncbi:hypothetical protein Sste5346_007704 [Sporothrix stenoceras]|uniref:Kinetochore protein fta4 n=1 Tax=Sporothrix stenoceras TaxID=5173 RepID=A0ABR3YTT7_9PEZI
MDDPPTIIALKQAFLEIATRQLAQPLAPSRTWQRKNDLRGTGRGSDAAVAAEGSAADGEDGSDGGRRIPPKVVDDVLVRTNQLMLLHARRVHTTVAVRHVAEQLDQLYQINRDDLVAGPGNAGSESLGRGADYTSSTAIFGLPSAWDDSQEADTLPLEARRYTEQVAQLQALAERRTETATRVRRLRGIASLLESISSEGVPAQRSLITRDGPVEGQLERMRLLLARVGHNVTNLPAPDTPLRTGLMNGTNMDANADTATTMDLDDVKDVEDIGRQRAHALLGLF